MQIKTVVSGKMDNNTYVVSNDEECLIIDASAGIERLKDIVSDKKVLGIFLTHGHYDHFCNLEEIASIFNAPCYITKPELEKLYSPKANYSLIFGQFKICKMPEKDFVVLKPNEVLKLGSFLVKTFSTPGHTDGSICIDIDGEIFTGDTKFLLGHGRTDLISSDSIKMQESLNFLEKNFKGQNFYAGHGRNGKI